MSHLHIGGRIAVDGGDSFSNDWLRMEDLAHRYTSWKAPQTDGGALIWPDGGKLIEEARANHQHLAQESAACIQTTPLKEIRRQMREFLGFDDEQVVFAAGHQTELHHPGVWAKNALIHFAAEKAGGIAAHFAIDTDAPKHLSFRFPGYSQPITDDPSFTTAQWSGLLAPPSPAHLRDLAGALARAAAGWPFEPMAGQVVEILRRQAIEAGTLSAELTKAMHAFDWALGLRYSALLGSPIWKSLPYLALVHHMLANAGRFAADYNAALNAYRERNHIRTPGRPMPSLAARDDRCETPFWRDDMGRGQRVRAWVEKSGGRWTLVAGDDRFELDPDADAMAAADRLLQWCRRHNLRFAPRALTLTLTLRLLAVDQFVHGIGGGEYDQVTDDLIARHFGIDPPRFSVTTATLYFPTAAGRARKSIPDLLQEGHRLKHGLLGPRKKELVAAIAAAERASPQRSQLFQRLHQELAGAATNSPLVAKWRESLNASATRLIEERALFDRELFYAIQPKERLRMMMDLYEEKFKTKASVVSGP